MRRLIPLEIISNRPVARATAWDNSLGVFRRTPEFLTGFISSLIIFYQKTLSPDHGWFKFKYPYGYCRHYPSCSEYARQAVERHGLKGLWLSIKRLLRCHPWREPSIDLVP